MGRRVGGVIKVKADGQRFQAKGEFTYNVQKTKKEMIPGADNVHGYKEIPMVQFIEGAITDSDQIRIEDIYAIKDATISLDLANGKTIILREAVYAADGDATTDEGQIQVRFEGIDGEEIPA